MLEDGDGIDLVQCFNPRTDMWIDRPNMQIPRSGSAACVLDGFIYVIGLCAYIIFQPLDFSISYMDLLIFQFGQYFSSLFYSGMG